MHNEKFLTKLSLLSKDLLTLLCIQEAIDKIESFAAPFSDTALFYESKVHFDAVLMNFVVIGEAVDKLTPELKSTHPDIPWQKIKDFRNLVAHDYLGIDAEEVWQIIHLHLSPFKKRILGLIS